MCSEFILIQASQIIQELLILNSNRLLNFKKTFEIFPLLTLVRLVYPWVISLMLTSKGICPWASDTRRCVPVGWDRTPWYANCEVALGTSNSKAERRGKGNEENLRSSRRADTKEEGEKELHLSRTDFFVGRVRECVGDL